MRTLDEMTKVVREDGAQVTALVDELCEEVVVSGKAGDVNTQKISKGETVNVNHGIWAGSRGVYEGEANMGYVNVRLENGGVLQLPAQFVTRAGKLTA